MCPRSHCKAVAEPVLDPRTPSLGFRTLSRVAHWLRDASCLSRYTVVSSRKNSQALGGQDAVSAVAHLCVLRGFGMHPVFLNIHSGFGFPVVPG